VGDEQDRASELRQRLWNEGWAAGTPTHYDRADPPGFDQAVLEQYKLYVEMADRISQRRALANTFFVSLNTGVLTLIAALWDKPPGGHVGWLAVPATVLMAECFAWYYIVRSYRQLNSAKYEVVGALEERLPASPYWRAEWWALGEGKDPSRYWPISHIEQWLPVLFAATYLTGYIALLVA
jgi:hypothetical protein